MSAIINDPALLALLTSGKPIELTDSSGRVLGVFTPSVSAPTNMTKEEIAALVREKFSPQEFLNGLRDIRENGGHELGNIIKELQEIVDAHERA
jgi:hypothetical protein